MENFPFLISHFPFFIEEREERAPAVCLLSSVRPMRLDLFLKASRLCGGRTLAQKLCEASRVSVNGSSAKSSHAVKPGDEILIRRHNTLTTIRVVSVPTTRQVSRKDASTLYDVVSNESLDLAEL